MRELSRTVEAENPNEHFKADSAPASTSDGAGGTLTAIAAIREPTADDTGQLVFFWHGDTFLGWDSLYENTRVTVKAAGPGEFEVTYASNDGEETREPVVVTYAWNGSRLVPDGDPPSASSTPVAVKRSESE